MNRNELRQRITGSLANALIGDAMGSATEGLTPEKILQHFGGKVTRFYPPPDATFARGRKAGQLTDDTTQMLMMLEAISEDGGVLKVETVAKWLLKWAEDEALFQQFAGPSTRRAVQRLKDGASPYETGKPSFPMDMGASNGAAMKVAPAGLAHAGDPEAAVRDAATMCIPTHNTDLAFAGAGAVAASVAAALTPKADVLSVADAALFGARKGYEIARTESVMTRSPSMVERIKLAVTIAASGDDFDETCARLGDVIGCGLPIIEAVPAAIGLFVAARGDAQRSVTGAVNLGGDADTVAAIAGAISGAYSGIEGVDPQLVADLLEVNAINLDALAERILNLPTVHLSA